MKKSLMSAIIIATMITMAPAAFAGNKNKEKKVKTETSANIDVEYVGEADGSVLLQVKLSKTGERQGLLRITDGFGELLHTERVTGNNFARYIKVSPDELKSIEVSYDTVGGFSKKRFNLTVSRSEEFRIEEVSVN